MERTLTHLAQAGITLPTVPQLMGVGKSGQFLALMGKKIVLDNGVAVGGISKRCSQIAGVAFCLFQTGFGRLVFCFGLDHGNRKGISVTQQIVNPTRLAVTGPVAPQPNPAGRISLITVIIMLTRNLRMGPAGGL